MRYDPLNSETIVALATPDGVGAIGIIRVSGKNAFAIASLLFYKKNGKSVDVSKLKSHTVHFGVIKEKDIVLDEVLLTVFVGPHSYTAENIVEFSCHGSRFIQQQLIQLLIRKGARLADAGEFTFRAFFNKRLDLVQAEAVADLIASTSATSHQVAMQQMRGGFSTKIKVLRENLVNFASLIELELDFSEEDVEFADRDDLKKLVLSIQKVIHRLVESFELGNVIKNGIPVAIVGKPNSGKSTLLNVLLEEDRAIVSEIPGTTRDIIEDDISIDGILFRFIDTAGIRQTSDLIEQIGVSRTFEKIQKSSIIVYLFDVHELTSKELQKEIDEIKEHLNERSQLIIVGNKIDKEDLVYTEREFAAFKDILFISAKERINMDALRKRFVDLFDSRTINVTETVVTNVRHMQALHNAGSALEKVYDGLSKNISGELISVDIKNALHQLGLITGEVTTEDLLQNIFSKFCIGK
ncbi:MAG: tRNA uridine-5-carboxymethylaminomethyl(34) synthesis GTPase MnmE [Bacteroidetes bacterium]|nr:tRNA uridine-5-carboxymethylaminomethyl(34) synthesis GTPase MnmE [Bacteroidota bacterium]